MSEIFVSHSKSVKMYFILLHIVQLMKRTHKLYKCLLNYDVTPTVNGWKKNIYCQPFFPLYPGQRSKIHSFIKNNYNHYRRFSLSYPGREGKIYSFINNNYNLLIYTFTDTFLSNWNLTHSQPQREYHHPHQTRSTTSRGHTTHPPNPTLTTTPHSPHNEGALSAAS